MVQPMDIVKGGVNPIQQWCVKNVMQPSNIAGKYAVQPSNIGG